MRQAIKRFINDMWSREIIGIESDIDFCKGHVMLVGFPAFSKDISAVQLFSFSLLDKEETVFFFLFPLSLPINRLHAPAAKNNA